MLYPSWSEAAFGGKRIEGARRLHQRTGRKGNADQPFEPRHPAVTSRRRALAAAEARVIGCGGMAQVAAATGLARDTISAGPQELDAPHSEFMGGFVAASLGVVRRSGGGRKSTALKDPSLVPDLLSLVNPTTRGDPQSALRWSCKSLRVLADELKRLEHNVSHVRVGQLLKAQGYSLQGNAKVIEGNQSPDRNAQFEREAVRRAARKSTPTHTPRVWSSATPTSMPSSSSETSSTVTGTTPSNLFNYEVIVS